MRENVGSEISVDEMAERAGLSVSRVTHLFTAQVGASPHRYFKSLKLELVKELLETTLLRMDQIAKRAGLKSRSHLEQDFKKEFGLTPRRYRMWRWSQDNWVRGRGRLDRQSGHKIVRMGTK